MNVWRSHSAVKTRIRVGIVIVELQRIVRECGLPPEILAQAPYLLDAITKPLDWLAEKAEKFARAVSDEPENFENHYRDNRRRVVAYSWEVAYIVEGCERITYEFACACLRANRVQLGKATLNELASRENGESAYVEYARRKIARISWSAGDRETALMMMRSVRGRSARSQYRAWLGEMAVRNGLMLAESREFESARATLMGGLRAGGMNAYEAEQVAAVYLAAAGAPSISLTAVTNTMHKANPRPIVLSGFGWSGSGAIGDFLKGHSEVEDIFRGREIGLWTGKYGLDRLYAYFIAKGFKRRLLLEFLARHCFGQAFLADSRGIKNSGGLWARFDEAQRGEFLSVLAAWLSAVRRWSTDPSRPLLEPFQSFSSQLLRLLSKETSTWVLLSNCVPCDAIVGVRMFKAPVVVVSWRDPGDAYTSKAAAFPDNRLGFAGWRSQLMSRIDNYLNGKKQVASFASVWIDLTFEEFVQSEALRRQLLSALNLSPTSLAATFDPTVSAKNIGILRTPSAKQRSAWRALASAVEAARREAQAMHREGNSEVLLQ